MLLTKHCRPEVREYMLNGQFKIGSHKEYSKGLATGTLSDTAEGNGGFSVKGGYRNASMEIGGFSFENLSISNCIKSFQYDYAINSLMFCASEGPYKSNRHALIVRGDPCRSYAPNPDYIAYITLDASLLVEALTAATNEHFSVSTRWVGQRVLYDERHSTINSKDFKGFSDAEITSKIFNQAFLKPRQYEVEEEFRFLLVGLPNKSLPEAIYTTNLSERIQKAFRRAVVDVGDVVSRMA